MKSTVGLGATERSERESMYVDHITNLIRLTISLENRVRDKIILTLREACLLESPICIILSTEDYEAEPDSARKDSLQFFL